MKRARQKLHSRSGASILLALYLMLVAAVIVSAAVTAAHRVRDDRTEVQDSLSITSAGKLMVQYLKDHDTYRTVQYTDHFFGDDSTDGTGACLKALTDSPTEIHYLCTTAPTDMKPALMALTLKKNENDGYTTDEKIWYDIKGTIGLASDVLEMNESPQTLYLVAVLTVNTVVRPKSDYETDKQINPDTGEEETIPHSGTETVITWELNNVRIASSEEMLWNESATE